MSSTVVLATAIASFIGFFINTSVMLVILSRGRKKYHLLFALLLFTAAFWDFGIFLVMMRNHFPNEVVLYQGLIAYPLTFFPALVYHFTATYLNQPRTKSTIAIYAYCSLAPIAWVAGLSQPVSSVYNYSWGIIGKQVLGDLTIGWFMLYFLSILVSCWLLLQARKRESSSVTRRHITYIVVSFIVFSLAPVKVLSAHGFDVAFTLPLGILLIGSFGALIGMAIIKDRLFDITVLVRKGIVYSVLVVLIISIFDLLQSLLATFLAGIAGEPSVYANFASIAVVGVASTPIKQRLERIIGGILTKKKIEF